MKERGDLAERLNERRIKFCRDVNSVGTTKI